ncbi:hypothetical protein P0J07_000593 [Vibrio fluvialis]|nr:hypothetical protein [Vibrio fluvialis]
MSAVYPDIEERVVEHKLSDERHLWWEMSCCILSSQVPYELATSAADAIDSNGCLYTDKYKVSNELENEIKIILSGSFDVLGKLRRYRFPNAKARQIVGAYSAVMAEASSLNGLLQSFESGEYAREWLVKNASGMGPKQASMFLRNCGYTYDLAVLDRHVLNYMGSVGLFNKSSPSISTLKKYLINEKLLKEHANDLGCSVGLLDWAIWIVMRVSNQRIESV